MKRKVNKTGAQHIVQLVHKKPYYAYILYISVNFHLYDFLCASSWSCIVHINNTVVNPFSQLCLQSSSSWSCMIITTTTPHRHNYRNNHKKLSANITKPYISQKIYFSLCFSLTSLPLLIIIIKLIAKQMKWIKEIIAKSCFHSIQFHRHTENVLKKVIVSSSSHISHSTIQTQKSAKKPSSSALLSSVYVHIYLVLFRWSK